MEVAVIDWKSIDSRFAKDEVYENINAPQWVDFSAPDASVDDESWFCRPDCNHPKRVEDFFKETTPHFKRSASVSEILPFGERTRRDATLKKRGLRGPSISPIKDLKYGRITEDSENQNPNFLTPPHYKGKFMKEGIKSGTEKKQIRESTLKKEQPRSLRSTLSAKNLFAGSDILNKVAEFCNELKKLATRAKDRENVEEKLIKDHVRDDSGDLDDKEKERKPLLEASMEKHEAQQNSKFQDKRTRKKRYDDAENTPVTINVKTIKHQEETLLQIRTCPPTPQCFSASRGPSNATHTPPQAFKSRMPERGVLQELGQRNFDEKNNEIGKKSNHGGHAAMIGEKEAKPLDVLWFLKPCTLSS
ncbi:uncharacterized protein LOC113762644 [Coffea eugenioides]|uniref:uncharacterized protein LOC113762644 n=1 Tax=Coffea eugenioides TaxID=49369 RepID=UPI000F60BF63|nr:uncharacterized protein LOC113762644 [Coffea eugenioides]